MSSLAKPCSIFGVAAAALGESGAAPLQAPAAHAAALRRIFAITAQRARCRVGVELAEKYRVRVFLLLALSRPPLCCTSSASPPPPLDGQLLVGPCLLA